MKEKSINWKKVKWLLLIPVIFAASVGYVSFHGEEQEVHEEEPLYALSDRTERESGTSGQEKQEEETSDPENPGAELSGKDIFIDVGGAVVMPQVVCIREGSRVYEAISAAGGTVPEADTRYMNLAAVCEDGQKIYVPTAEELKKEDPAGAISSSAGYVVPSASPSDAASEGNANRKINVNTASSEELQTLSGIGPSMAQRIIDYRNANGKFLSVEDLTNVSGIGEKTLQKFIHNICV